jgi:hypothetical protein
MAAEAKGSFVADANPRIVIRDGALALGKEATRVVETAS